MLVRIYKDGSDRTGLHIGEANARRYFSRRKPSIELRLDDLHIRCTLSPDFWHGRPEIHDSRLSGWLEFKIGRRAAGREPMLLSMVPSGSGSFEVRPHSAKHPESFGADIARPRIARSKPVRSHHPVAPIPVLSIA
jgi:hypothetical protein